MSPEDKKKIAQQLVQNQEFVTLLKEFFTMDEKLNPDLLQHKTNAELGEIIRADIQAEMKIKLRLDRLIRLGSKPAPQNKNYAPR